MLSYFFIECLSKYRDRVSNCFAARRHHYHISGHGVRYDQLCIIMHKRVSCFVFGGEGKFILVSSSTRPASAYRRSTTTSTATIAILHSALKADAQRARDSEAA